MPSRGVTMASPTMEASTPTPPASRIDGRCRRVASEVNASRAAGAAHIDSMVSAAVDSATASGHRRRKATAATATCPSARSMNSSAPAAA